MKSLVFPLNFKPLLLFSLAIFSDPSKAFESVSYYSLWSVSTGFRISDVPAEHLTRFIYSHLKISEDLKCTIPSRPSHVNREFLVIRKLRRKNPTLKVMASIAGKGSSEKFRKLSHNSKKAEIFVSSCIKILQTYGLDGIDIDWEYPRKSDSTALKNLLFAFQKPLSELKKEGKPIPILSLTLPGKKRFLEQYPLRMISDNVDAVNLMAYDYVLPESRKASHLAPFTTSDKGKTFGVEQSVEYLINHGLRPSKIILGIPLYGYGWKLEGPLSSKDWEVVGQKTAQPMKNPISLGRIQNYMKSGFKRIFDPKTRSYFLLNRKTSEFITYEDPITSSEKMKYAAQKGLKGVFVWEQRFDSLKSTAIKSLFPLKKK